MLSMGKHIELEILEHLYYQVPPGHWQGVVGGTIASSRLGNFWRFEGGA